MRTLLLLTLILAVTVFVGCSSGASATSGPTETPPLPTPSPTLQATATPIAAQPSPVGNRSAGVEEQRVKDLEFRVSGLERLLSAGDGMFSLEDDLSNVDGRLRAQQRCINALVIAARSHEHSSSVEASTGPPQFKSVDAEGLDDAALARMLSVECGPAVDESLLVSLAEEYGIDLR